MNHNITPANRNATQHNLLIRAPFRMTIIESRIFTLLLSYIHKFDNEFKEINLPLNYILGKKPSGKAYSLVKKACKSLLDRSVNIPKNSNELEINGIHFFESIQMVKGKGIVTAWFSESIKPYLINLKGNFTTSEIKTLLSLRNPHAHRMYWFLKSFSNLKVKIFTVSEIRFMLLADSKKYESYGEFNKHVFKPAIEEILNLNCGNLKFKYFEIKETSKIVSKLKFTFFDITDRLPKEPWQPQVEPTPSLIKNGNIDVIKNNAIRIMKVNYSFTEQQVSYFINKLPPLIITKANNWFNMNKSTLNYSSKTEWFASYLKNKIKGIHINY